jgi:hypothetical protein
MSGLCNLLLQGALSDKHLYGFKHNGKTINFTIYEKMKRWRTYPKEEGNKDIGCHLEPCLCNVRAASTFTIILLTEHFLKGLEWQGTQCLNTIESVYHAGLDM